MNNNSAVIVQKLWNYCHVLRDEGVSYGDYVEQLTYLVFLKMADEQAQLPFNDSFQVPQDFDWQSLINLDGDELEVHYRHILEELSKEKGMLGVIFRKAQNKIRDPAKLRRLIKLINEEVWHGLNIDVKGDIYEGLLQKNAEDIKTGAGQYFTPRPLIRAMVECIEPKPKQTICDPACGTGGFFLASHDYISKNFPLDKDEKKFLREETISGWDIVNDVVRLCTMNLFLHGIGKKDEPPIINADSLASDPGERYDYVFTNPPFGKKSSITILNADGKASREIMASI